MTHWKDAGWLATTVVSQPERDAPFHIAAYDVAHLPEMVDLWIASWAEAMPDIDFEARRGWLCDHVDALMAGSARIFCAFDPFNGDMAGFVAIDPGMHWLDQLVVSVAHKGTGAAGQLLAAARGVSPGLIRLDVNAENARARAFYARQGFSETGRGRNLLSGRKTVMLEWRAPPAG